MSMYEMRERVGGWIPNAVTRNPEGLLLLAAGAALLLRSGRGQRQRYAQTFPTRKDQYRAKGGDHITDRINEGVRRASEYVSETTDKVSETARSYASSAADYADEATRLAAERSRQVADKTRETAEYMVREQPWAVAVTGLLAGAAVAAIFPPSRIERRALGGVGERLRSAASSMGEQVIDAGLKAGERLSEVAEERGLTTEGLKEAARDVGETFSSALGGEESASAPRSNTKQGEQAGGLRTGPRQGQSGTGTTQSNKSGGAGRPPGETPSGGGGR
jgi:ElaB/YqjD/DUF883 family membrane-anchored ribosome-binding protein